LQAQFEPGDLLFKGADSGTGATLAARWSFGDTRWGHVGVLAGDAATGWYVIHADTGTSEAARAGQIGSVVSVPLSEFLTDVKQLGHFRVGLAGEDRERYVEAVSASVGLPFDRAYSLDSANALYCTELIWRALSAGLERDAVPKKSERFGRIYIALSDLSLHENVREVSVTARALQR
jgi:hypothetical protein